MANTIHVDIVSPEGQLFSGEATMVFIPAAEGDIGVAPRHTPLLTLMRPGIVRVQVDGQAEQTFFVGGGALEVQPALVSILADTALRAHDVDEAAAQDAKRRAEEAVRTHTDKMDIVAAELELARAVAQLKVIEQLRNKR